MTHLSTVDSTPLAIFDHDGVLVDSLALHQSAWLALGKRCNLPITADFIRETFGMTNPTIFRKLLGDNVLEDEVRQYGVWKEECYREEAMGRIVLMDGVQSLLDRLSAAGVRLAIGSSSVRPNLDLTVESCGLAGRFAAIASLEDIRNGKPDPEVFLVAAARAGCEPSRAVVFEDAPVGIQAAKAAGMRAIGVTTTHPAESLYRAGADEVVDRVDRFDVAAFLSSL